MTSDIADDGVDKEKFRYLSPPEYIKRANARDAIRKHDLELHDFVRFVDSHPDRETIFSEESSVDTMSSEFLDSYRIPGVSI